MINPVSRPPFPSQLESDASVLDKLEEAKENAEATFLAFIVPKLISRSKVIPKVIQSLAETKEQLNQLNREQDRLRSILAKGLNPQASTELITLTQKLVALEISMQELEKTQAEEVQEEMLRIEKEAYAAIASPENFFEPVALELFLKLYNEYNTARLQLLQQILPQPKGQQLKKVHLKKVHFPQDVLEQEINKLKGLKQVIAQYVQMAFEGLDEDPRNRNDL